MFFIHDHVTTILYKNGIIIFYSFLPSHCLTRQCNCCSRKFTVWSLRNKLWNNKLTCRPESSAELNSLLISTISIFCGACRWTQKMYVTISHYFYFLWKWKMENGNSDCWRTSINRPSLQNLHVLIQFPLFPFPVERGNGNSKFRPLEDFVCEGSLHGRKIRMIQ